MLLYSVGTFHYVYVLTQVLLLLRRGVSWRCWLWLCGRPYALPVSVMAMPLLPSQSSQVFYAQALYAARHYVSFIHVYLHYAMKLIIISISKQVLWFHYRGWEGSAENIVVFSTGAGKPGWRPPGGNLINTNTSVIGEAHLHCTKQPPCFIPRPASTISSLAYISLFDFQS